MKGLSIGELARESGLKPDTLRYYERIGLLPRVARDAGGRRRYQEADCSRLRFILRARAMDFSLEEIAALLQMREEPQRARAEVRALTRRKLEQVERRLESLDLLRRELQLLLSLCRASEEGCPIIEQLEDQ